MFLPSRWPAARRLNVSKLCFWQAADLIYCRTCIDHLTKCLMIVTSPTVIKAAVCDRQYQPSEWPFQEPAGCWPSDCCLETQVSKHASGLMLPALPPHPRHVRGPPMMIFASAGDIVLPLSLVVCSLGTTNDVGGTTAAVALCIAVCSSSDNWELPWWLGAQQSRTSTLPTQWCLHAGAFDDRMARWMCLCWVALSCSYCDVINRMLQIRRIRYRSVVALSSLMLQITADVPVSDVRRHYRSDTSVYWLYLGQSEFRMYWAFLLLNRMLIDLLWSKSRIMWMSNYLFGLSRRRIIIILV